MRIAAPRALEIRCGLSASPAHRLAATLRYSYRDASTGLALAARHAEIVEVRRLGAMIAFELGEGGDPHRPAAELTKKLTVRARELGLILLSCGVYGNVVRILVPLTAECYTK